MATIRDVAKRADLSVGTVSHVLTGSGKVGKARRERGSGSHPRTGLRAQHGGARAGGAATWATLSGRRRPGDVQRLPFGDVIQPRLTAVAQPAYEIGYQSVELLIGRIEGRITAKGPVHMQLDPELVVRASSVASLAMLKRKEHAR